MRFFKFVIFCLALSMAGQISWAQDKLGLEIGDQMPDLILKTSINSIGDIDTKKLRGKLIIFDFWNTTCTSCIEAFPKMEALQAKFKDDIVIILVTRDTKEKVDALFRKSAEARTKLPIVTNDTVLVKYFNVLFPHHAWISKQGRVVAIANAYNATVANIEKAISGKELGMTSVKLIDNFDYRQPLTQLRDSVYTKVLRQYSALTAYVNGIVFSGGLRTDPVSKKVVWRSFYNKGIINLFKYAYGGFNERNNIFGNASNYENVILEGVDSTKFLPPKNVEVLDTWMIENLYCYEIGIMPNGDQSMAENMRSELSRYFKLDVSIVNKKKDVLALSELAHTPLTPSKEVVDYIEKKKNYFALRMQNLDQITKFLNSHSKFNLVFNNQTQSKQRIDLDVSFKDLNDLASLSISLNKVGILLETKEISVPYLLLKGQDK